MKIGVTLLFIQTQSRAMLLTYGYGPNCSNFHNGLGAGIEAAVLNGIANCYVPIKRDGTEMHNRCS